ncbi:hypothetical protein Moror_3535 [Moniliophthora roreri MCA 2997]|uniref:Uncharacterized protein n=1 Tax=Moniliophthora roreri (strain MCA 2997) TaxID=1381753 RepID=V2WLG1_MONRO|nr:hypothetical protein Moror_3535 [Moniliophthora roreri MCA 2997]
MTRKVKSKSTAAPIASSSKSKDVSLPQLSSINTATLSILHLHCTMLFDTCHNIWRHLEGRSSLFTDTSALVNYAFPAMKIPLVPLDKYCGKFWFPHTFMCLLLLALQLLKCLESRFSISIPNNLYNHEDSDSSNEDGSGDEDIVKVKPSKCPVHSIKPPAHATPIVEVLARSSKTKQKSQPATSSSTQVTIKTEPFSSKCKVHDTSPPQPSARKHAHTVTKAADKSSDPKGKRHAIDPPPDKGEKDISLLLLTTFIILH